MLYYSEPYPLDSGLLHLKKQVHVKPSVYSERWLGAVNTHVRRQYALGLSFHPFISSSISVLSITLICQEHLAGSSLVEEVLAGM